MAAMECSILSINRKIVLYDTWKQKIYTNKNL